MGINISKKYHSNMMKREKIYNVMHVKLNEMMQDYHAFDFNNKVNMKMQEELLASEILKYVGNEYSVNARAEGSTVYIDVNEK